MSDKKEFEFKEMKAWGKVKLWWQKNEKYISLIAFLIFLWALWYSLRYFPILLPDKFTETPVKASDIPNITVYYPARVVDGRDYEIVIHFMPPTNGADTEYEYSFSSDWKDVVVNPSSVKFNVIQEGAQKEIVTLDLQSSNDLPDDFTLTVRQKGPPADVEMELPIRIVEFPDYVILAISFIASFGALILGYLISIISWLVPKFKKSV